MASRDVIGPALPPHFDGSTAEADSAGDFVQGPALPPDYKSNPERYGCDQECTSPCVPREMVWDSEDDKDTSPTPRKQRRYQEEEDDGFFGPTLPPGFQKPDESPERPVIGPALPPGFKKLSEVAEENRCYTIQATDSSEEEENVIGPMPAKGLIESNTATEFEYRAQRMKEKLLGKDDESKQVTRETWMTDLPPELKNFGLGPRTFKRRAHDKSVDRSVWTDTPADREKKAREAKDAKKSISKDDAEILLSERDKRLVEQLSSYNDSQRSESLMDIHQKKLKSKSVEEKNKPQERRPFDRDQDLQVHQFDEAQKKALLKKSRDLNTRFSHGKCNMFL
ncbi:GPALPP motifs-containing protein 1 isoform X2 [Rhineura floridana]|uniref:GPALPP motifs-containing protein 1 isoform X2 n=1 Tax=Rhineura floridana TaxID=261503 RepID=UPI002AC871BB|nr:GPALPP motifs-containing protein 1 isoform X2 [Rhineura floridana]